MARTFPTAVPAITTSPALSVPFCTKRVAIGPLPLSRRASMTVPFANRLGFAFSSLISATNVTISKSPSILMRFLAETSTQMVSPPQSSGTSSCSANCSFTRCTFAFSLSILLIATIMLTSAALA